MYLVTAQEMRAFDATAIQDYGIPGVVLMENAGRTTFHVLKKHLGGDLRDLRVSVIAGPGNNGGDGFVIARYLINHGSEVNTFLLSPREKIKGDALINLKVLEKMTSRIFPVTDAESMDHAALIWQESEVIVDAILGTGLTSEVRSPYREAILEINDTTAIILSVDLPSGLDADTGKILGCAVRADITATYGFRKLGIALYPGVDYCGAVEVVDISIPLPAVEKNPPRAVLYAKPDAEIYYHIRMDPEAHKGRFGHLLVVGGSPGKTGAPAMAARAASRVGAGLVTVGVPASLNPILEAKLTEEMTEPLPESVPGYLGTSALDRVLSLADGKLCIAIGPGLSTAHDIPDMVEKFLSAYSGWVVIDADGLNALSGRMEALRTTNAQVVLTPHPGEMGRLCGISSQEVQEDRVGIARKLAADYGVWVILKGARTLTASPNGRIFVNSTGNPWMASGGQGDVLTGILGGLLVQGIPPEEALPFGVYIHGLAADKLVEKIGPAPVTATDVLDEIRILLGGKTEEE
ncbi:MAG: NAD(P)H-hydrate dehydratase [Desulfomonile tiedjei]|uniref:Bifunctional NAD(P)H-hydrate repair enzyme n=1 Tax=Desulfomonile tiedjei TaxID=2358 RepID=A0A9D6Z8L2_9BACT|nr:NAD(P)H-hydrate dehydratase [Desulfomonile tiedjei]